MNRSEKYEQIRQIADAICAKELKPEQIKSLDKLLLGDPEAQQFYYDYIEMHIQMQAEVGPPMEVVRRRLQVDEVIFRPSNQHSTPPLISEQDAPLNAITHVNKPYQEPSKKWLAFSILLTALIVIIITFVFLNFHKQAQVAEILNADGLRIEGQGKIESNLIYPGAYSTLKPTTLILISGEQLTLAKDTLIKFYNTAEIEIIRGELSIDNATGNNLIFNTANFIIHSGGADVAIDLTTPEPQVRSSDKTLLFPKRWRPNHYWPFENDSDRVIDYAGNAYGIVGSGVTKVNGLVGKGAFSFDDGANARINVGSGGGTVPATGTFSVIDGVTIEALVVPNFKGQVDSHPATADRFISKQDQIFRKDQTDKMHRMLLSFKNTNKPNGYGWPKGIKGNSIAFGMYLIGQGYHELILPLDGKQGRPTLNQLKDGQAHHIIGLYNVKTGLKAIFVDGEMQTSYQYPPGTKMISGGSGMANIGNSPNRTDSREAYGGIIDEVAFYDFALPNYTIRQHYQATISGNNYFNIDLADQVLPYNISIPLPANEQVNIDPITGLISSTTPINQR